MSADSKPKKRGGSRAGAGMKAQDGAAVRRVQLTLDEDTRAVFAELGGGNVSLGARMAARSGQRSATARLDYDDLLARARRSCDGEFGEDYAPEDLRRLVDELADALQSMAGAPTAGV